MMKTIALDANVIIDVFLKRANVPRYRTIFEEIQTGNAIALIPIPAIVEIDWVLKASYGITKEKRIEHLYVVLELLDPIDFVAYTLREALTVYEQHDGVNLSDCVIALVALDARVDEFVTGDKKLARLYQSLKKRRIR